MSRTRKHIWSSPCECLEQAFGQSRLSGAKSPIVGCTSDDCPIREVEPIVVGEFLRFIGGVPDESFPLAVKPSLKRLSALGDGLKSRNRQPRVAPPIHRAHSVQ